MDGVFRMGMVDQHKHLLKPGDECIGGGYYVQRIAAFGLSISTMMVSTMISMSANSCRSNMLTDDIILRHIIIEAP